jgi:hypothetical protein
VAINYYTIHFLKKNDAGEEQKESRRITHTWVRDGSGWKILGGMSKPQFPANTPGGSDLTSTRIK